ncbi:hypothetical protein ACIRPU_40255 [Streptomyces sp. NPDC102259]|uniref:hypothetical protein n=1 Tax=Streptomyces sp. NPDC102259 TaxID=3366148 RepID=UPI003816A13E
MDVATARDEFTSYEFRQTCPRLLAESGICIVCGRGASDTADHVISVSKGSARLDPDNLAPIRGVVGCPVCLRKCNSEKGDRPLADVVQLHRESHPGGRQLGGLPLQQAETHHADTYVEMASRLLEPSLIAIRGRFKR